MKKYKQPTSAQRYAIQNGLKQGMGRNSIAALIEVSESTVSREIKRNGGHKAYNADKVQMEINSRPRKKLGFKTPKAQFYKML